MTTFNGTPGADTFLGSDGIADTFRFTPASLSANDTVVGGSGAVIDTLLLTSAGIISAAELAHVSGLERVILAPGSSSFAVTALLGSGAGTPSGAFTVIGGSGSDVVNASAVTAAGRVVFAAGAGAVSFAGGAGSDLVSVDLATLFGNDVLLGGGSTVLGDALQVNQAGYLSATRLAGVSGFERIVLANGTNTVVLNDAVLAANGGRLTIVGGSGEDAVNATGLTGVAGTELVAGGGADILLGGAGADTFTIDAANLLGSDTFQGGGGTATDILRLTSAGMISAANLAHVGGIERIALASGDNNVTLTNAVATGVGVTGAALSVVGGAGNDVVNAGAVTAQGRIAFSAGAGADTFLGGAGSDVVLIDPAQLSANDAFSGGANTALGDAILLTAPGTVIATQLSGVTGVERIQVAAGTNIVAVSDSVLDNNPGLSIVGGVGNDIVDGLTLSAGHGLTVVAGSGADSFYGGAGADNFVIDASDLLANDTFVGGKGSAIDVLTLTGFGSPDLAGVSGIERIVLDTQSTGGLGVLEHLATGVGVPGAALTIVDLFGNAGIDAGDVSAAGRIVFQSVSGGYFRAGAGDDTYIGGVGSSTSMNGGSGDDLFMLTEASSFGYDIGILNVERIQLADGLNTISFSDRSIYGPGTLVSIAGGSGNDTVSVLAVKSSFVITAGDGDDTLDSDGLHNTLYGGDGNDTLRARGIGDTVFGDDGNDTVGGFFGTDTLSGGSGNDVFSFTNRVYALAPLASDVLLDFSAVDDKLQFLKADYAFNGATFNVAIDDSVGGSSDISAADLVRLSGNVANGDTVLAYLDSNPNAPDAPLFVVAQAGNGHTFLYHVDNAADPSAIDTIADLGAVAPTAIGTSHFVFV